MIYNGVNLEDFNVAYMDESAFIAVPSISYTATSVAGRNGDLHYSNNRYGNLTVKATCIILDDIRRYYGDLAAFLMQDADYHRLEGFKEPDVYRMAAVKEIGTPKLRSFARGGSFTVTFDCKPLRYLKSGEETIEFTGAGILHNEYRIASRPLLRAYGYGTIVVGTGKIKIASDVGEYIDIDCEMKDAYVGTENRNSFITVTQWPELTQGDNSIALSSTISKIEITPRWVTL